MNDVDRGAPAPCALCGATVPLGAGSCPSCGESVTQASAATVRVEKITPAVPPPAPPPAGPEAAVGGEPGPRGPAAPGQAGAAPLQSGPTTWSPAGPAAPGADPAPPTAAPPRRGRGLVVGGVALVVLALVAALVVVLLAGGGDDDGPTATRDGADEPAVEDDAAALGEPADGEGEEADAAADTTIPEPDCPVDANVPEFKRMWQDADGIHLVVVVRTTCESDQVLADPAATFAVVVNDDEMVTASFDFSATPVSIPASGASGEIELVYDPAQARASVGRFRVSLPEDRSRAITAGVGVRYLFVCEQEDGGEAEGRFESSGAGATSGRGEVPAVGTLPVDPAPGDDAAALVVLEQIHAEQASVRAAVEGLWVPQVATKSLQDWPETPQDDRVSLDFFKNGEILHTPSVFLERFRAWQARYPDAFLVRGSDFDSICGYGRGLTDRCLGFWLIAIDRPQPTSPAVFDGFCQAEGLNDLSPDPNNLHCIAKVFRQTDSTDTIDNGT